jgi:hypothetical protein
MVEIEPGLCMVGGTNEIGPNRYLVSDFKAFNVSQNPADLAMIEGVATCWYCQKDIRLGEIVSLAPGCAASKGVFPMLPVCPACRALREAREEHPEAKIENVEWVA